MSRSLLRAARGFARSVLAGTLYGVLVIGVAYGGASLLRAFLIPAADSAAAHLVQQPVDEVNSGDTIAPSRATTSGGSSKVWNSRTGEMVAELKGAHKRLICCVRFSSDGNRIVTAAHDKKVVIWNAKSGEIVAELLGHTKEVDGIALSPDGRLLATASLDGTAMIWKLP